MASIVEVMRLLPDFYPGSGTSSASIKEAEERLGVAFSHEYREYLREFGDASVNGHEITGIAGSTRIDVVEVTLAERVRNPSVPANLYVVEQSRIDRIVVWQDSSGTIYQTAPGMRVEKIFVSLGEYLAS